MLDVPSLNLRHSVRAIILTDDDRVLLCRHLIPGPPGRGVWAAPGGGVAYRGPDLFGPRDLATPLMALVTRGVPAEPISLGL
jgi:hypothetical protein